MSDWPTLAAGPVATIGTQEPEGCFAAQYVQLTGRGAGVLTAWVTNQAKYVAIYIESPVVVRHLSFVSGTGTNDVDLGIFDDQRNKIVSTGASAQTASALNVRAITATMLMPGNYFLGMSRNGTGNAYAWAINAEQQRGLGCQEQATAHPLPATATFATPTTTLVPLITAHVRAVV